jgi:predicted dehydrogenase
MVYALIGCGRIATNHITAALRNGLDIAAVCDVMPGRMEALLEKHGLAESAVKRYVDYRRMLEEIRPELVAVATESGLHAGIALDCIEAGCNVIIEKPIALSLRDADAIIDAAAKKNVVVSACHQNRFNVPVRHIRAAVEERRFGKMSHGTIHVRWNRARDYYSQAPWRGTWAQDGGALMNQGIHGIDLLRWMMGADIDEVFAYTARRFHTYNESEDLGLALIRFKNGALGCIEGTTNVFPRNLEETLYLFGENGTVKAGGMSMNTIEVWRFADERDEDKELAKGFIEETSNVYGNGHTLLYTDVVKAIKTGCAPYVDTQAGRQAVELVLAVYKSSAEGRPIKLPLTDCQTSDFIGRF